MDGSLTGYEIVAFFETLFLVKVDGSDILKLIDTTCIELFKYDVAVFDAKLDHVSNIQTLNSQANLARASLTVLVNDKSTEGQAFFKKMLIQVYILCTFFSMNVCVIR